MIPGYPGMPTPAQRATGAPGAPTYPGARPAFVQPSNPVPNPVPYSPQPFAQPGFQQRMSHSPLPQRHIGHSQKNPQGGNPQGGNPQGGNPQGHPPGHRAQHIQPQQSTHYSRARPPGAVPSAQGVQGVQGVEGLHVNRQASTRLEKEGIREEHSQAQRLSTTLKKLQQELIRDDKEKDVKGLRLSDVAGVKMEERKYIKVEPRESAYIERRLKWLEEDLQRNKTRLYEQPEEDQPDAEALNELLLDLEKERKGREELEQKISSLESTLMRKRAEYKMCMQQVQDKYKEVMSDMGRRFDVQLKAANEQLVAQSQKLEEMLKDVSQSLETRLANGSFTHWVPINLEKRQSEDAPLPSWYGMPAHRSSASTEAGGRPVSGSLQVARGGSKPRPSGGSMKIPRGPPEDVTGKALSEMLQKLHEENQELQRVHQELNQRHSRKGSKEASLVASRNSPIQTPGGFSHFPIYRPAG